MIPRKPKPKKCRWCRDTFQPERLMQKCCSPGCAISFIADQKGKKAEKEAKAERQKTKARLLELKPLQYWLKRAEKAVNALRREQDLLSGYGCITCGTHDADVWTAGHWISVGASSGTRYDYQNIHLQCHQCNYFGGGKAQDYEARLPARIGQANVDRLKSAKREKKWSIQECQAIEAKAKEELKALQKR